MPLTPGQLLAEIILRENIKKTDLAKKLGTTYLTVNRWTKDEGFDETNRRRAAEALELASNYFDKPDEAARLERLRTEAFQAFLGMELANTITENEKRTLSGIKFFDAPPTPELYAAWLLSMRGLISREKVEATARENVAAATRKGKRDPFDPG